MIDVSDIELWGTAQNVFSSVAISWFLIWLIIGFRKDKDSYFVTAILGAVIIFIVGLLAGASGCSMEQQDRVEKFLSDKGATRIDVNGRDNFNFVDKDSVFKQGFYQNNNEGKVFVFVDNEVMK